MNEARKNILDVTIKLLSNKTFDEISVVEICNEANISKRTFYNHYKDKFDIIIKAAAVPGLDYNTDTPLSIYTIERYLTNSYNWLVDHKKFVKNIVFYMGQNSPLNSLKKEFYKYLMAMIKGKMEDEEISSEIRYTLQYFVNAFTDFAINIIILDDNTLSDEFFKRDKYIENFIPNNLKQFLYY